MCIPINAAKPMIKSALENYDATANADLAAKNETPQPRLLRAAAVARASAPMPPAWACASSPCPGNYLPVAQGILLKGVYVSEVEVKSPAEEAGMKAGDIIVEAAGKVIKDTDALTGIISSQKAGDTLSIKVYRVEGLNDVLNSPEGISQLEKGEYVDLTVSLRVMENAARN